MKSSFHWNNCQGHFSGLEIPGCFFLGYCNLEDGFKRAPSDPERDTATPLSLGPSLRFVVRLFPGVPGPRWSRLISWHGVALGRYL